MAKAFGTDFCQPAPGVKPRHPNSPKAGVYAPRATVTAGLPGMGWPLPNPSQNAP